MVEYEDVKLSDLMVKKNGKNVSVEGKVIKIYPVKAKLVKSAWRCMDCGEQNLCSGKTEPSQCNKCDNKLKFIELPHKPEDYLCIKQFDIGEVIRHKLFPAVRVKLKEELANHDVNRGNMVVVKGVLGLNSVPPRNIHPKWVIDAHQLEIKEKTKESFLEKYLRLLWNR
jgi:DNA replicative helicase MCM subunit Mcm2 (Cdc46/Mcm family)